MAPAKKDNKRKATAAAVASDSPAKKTKKVAPKAAPKAAEPAEETPKSILKKKDAAATKEKKPVSAVKANGAPARQVKPRKRAADFLSDDEADSDVEAPKAKVEEKKKPENKKAKKEDISAKSKKPKATKEVITMASDDDEEEEISGSDASADEGEDDEAEDDQTAALIKGFESSGDEDESGDEGYDPSNPVPKIPDSKKAKRKLLKKQKNSEGNEQPGVIYVGRIPHGFYEHQMRAYFSQFGDITRLRLSRNRITGKSKHYAFIEFAMSSVAKIAAETMDNYLMYGHILKCKYVPSEQLHPELWKGANRRFKKTPWNRIEKKRLDKGKTREEWSNRIEKEEKKRLAKAEKLKALGYEIDLPQLKSVDDVPVQEPKAIEGAETTEEPAKAVEAVEAPAPKEIEAEKETDDTPKKAKKTKKAAQTTPKQETPKKEEAKASKKTATEQTASPAPKAGAGAKAKKAKKTKAKA